MCQLNIETCLKMEEQWPYLCLLERTLGLMVIEGSHQVQCYWVVRSLVREVASPVQGTEVEEYYSVPGHIDSVVLVLVRTVVAQDKRHCVAGPGRNTAVVQDHGLVLDMDVLRQDNVACPSLLNPSH